MHIYWELLLTLLKITATTIITPKTAVWKNGSTPNMLSALEITPKSNTPRNAPITIPFAPVKVALPIMQAANALNSYPAPVDAKADPILDASTKSASPQIAPQSQLLNSCNLFFSFLLLFFL